eukprot:2357047-Rhodomonas_salina.2
MWGGAEKIFTPGWRGNRARPQSAPPRKAIPSTLDDLSPWSQDPQSSLQTSRHQRTEKQGAHRGRESLSPTSPTSALSPQAKKEAKPDAPFLEVTGEKALTRRGLMFGARRIGAESKYVGLGRAMARRGGNDEEGDAARNSDGLADGGGEGGVEGGGEEKNATRGGGGGGGGGRSSWEAIADRSEPDTLRSSPLAVTLSQDAAPNGAHPRLSSSRLHISQAALAAPLQSTSKPPLRRPASAPSHRRVTVDNSNSNSNSNSNLPPHLRHSSSGSWRDARGWSELTASSVSIQRIEVGPSGLDASPIPTRPLPVPRSKSEGGRLSHESFKWHLARDPSRKGASGSSPTGAHGPSGAPKVVSRLR